MGIFRIIDVPDVAEFYKYWVVEESAAATLVYKDGFLTFEDALNFLGSNNNYKLIRNENGKRSEVTDEG